MIATVPVVVGQTSDLERRKWDILTVRHSLQQEQLLRLQRYFLMQPAGARRWRSREL